MTRPTRLHWQKLTYHKARRQWRKFKDGRYYYLGRSGVNKTDRQAHDEAWAEWEQISSELEAPARETERRVADLRAVGYTDRDFEQHARTGTSIEFAHAMAMDLPRQFGRTIPHVTDTVDAHIKLFLSDFATLGKSLSRAEALRCHLERFANWSPKGGNRIGDQPITSINARTITEYRASLWHLAKVQLRWDPADRVTNIVPVR